MSLEVSEVMRDPAGWGAGNEVRKAELVIGFVFVQAERRHPPRWFRRHHTSALLVWPLVMWEDSRPRLVARWFRGATVEWWTSGGVC